MPSIVRSVADRTGSYHPIVSRAPTLNYYFLLNGHQATFFLPRLSVVDGSNNAGINYVGGLTRRGGEWQRLGEVV